jgi:hypothetical protein
MLNQGVRKEIVNAESVGNTGILQILEDKISTANRVRGYRK